MAFLGAVKAITVGDQVNSRTFDSNEITNLIILGSAHCSTGTRFNSLRKVNGSGGSGYPVTTAKTLTMEAAIIGHGSATPTPSGIFAYADNDVGADSVTALTNGVWNFGDSTATIGLGNGNSNTGPRSVIIMKWQVPAGKFLIYSPVNANGSILAYCTEA